MWKQALLTFSLVSSFSAHASVADDIEQIRPLLPAGTDVAQVQASEMLGFSPREAMEAGGNNYLLRDLDGDRREDLLVISEEKPRREDYRTNQPCTDARDFDCMTIYGKRVLHFFKGKSDGGFQLAFTNDHFVLGADEGGVMGDPLQGFSLRPNGTITYSVYGGSAWRWSFSEVIQFRKGQLYVIGQDSDHGWTGDLRWNTKSVNLLTGQVIETTQKNGDTPVRTKKYRIAVKPLVKLKDYQGQDR